MHIVEWRIFQFEKPWQIYPKGSKDFIWSQAKNAKPCPQGSPRAVSEPDQSILREQWVFIFPIIPVYTDTEDFGVIGNWSSVVHPHFQKKVGG